MSNPYDVLSSQSPNGELVYPSDSLIPPPVKSGFAQKMMAEMGHVEEQGPGANGEGRTEPVEVNVIVNRQDWATGL